MPGWADQTGDEEQPLYHPLDLQNPPYIRTTNLTHLEAEVSGWADQRGDEE